MKVIRIKRPTVTPTASATAPDKKEGRVLSSRNETKLRQALTILTEVLRQVDAEDLIDGKTLVVWNEDDKPTYGILHSKHGDKEESSRVERLIAKEDDLADEAEYPLNGYRKTGRLDFIATAALVEIDVATLGELEVKSYNKDEERDATGRWTRGGSRPTTEVKYSESVAEATDRVADLEEHLEHAANYDPDTNGDDPENDLADMEALVVKLTKMTDKLDATGTCGKDKEHEGGFHDLVKEAQGRIADLKGFLDSASGYDPGTNGDEPEKDAQDMASLADKLTAITESLEITGTVGKGTKGKHDVSKERRDSNGRWVVSGEDDEDEDEDDDAEADDMELDGIQDQLDTWMEKPTGPRNTLVDQMRFLRQLEAKLDDVGEGAPTKHGAMRVAEIKRDIAKIRTRLNRNSKSKHDVSKEKRDANGRWTVGGSDSPYKKDDSKPYKTTPHSDSFKATVEAKLEDLDHDELGDASMNRVMAALKLGKIKASEKEKAYECINEWQDAIHEHNMSGGNLSWGAVKATRNGSGGLPGNVRRSIEKTFTTAVDDRLGDTDDGKPSTASVSMRDDLINEELLSGARKATFPWAVAGSVSDKDAMAGIYDHFKAEGWKPLGYELTSRNQTKTDWYRKGDQLMKVDWHGGAHVRSGQMTLQIEDAPSPGSKPKKPAKKEDDLKRDMIFRDLESITQGRVQAALSKTTEAAKREALTKLARQKVHGTSKTEEEAIKQWVNSLLDD